MYSSGYDQVNTFNVILTTNNDAVSLSQSNNSRYVCLDISEENIGNNDYFKALSKAIKSNHVLENFYNDMMERYKTICPNWNEDIMPETETRRLKIIEALPQLYKYIKEEFILKNTGIDQRTDLFLEEYKNYDIHLIANKNSKIENLPFKIEKFYPVGFSAWINDYYLIEEILKTDPKNKLFLFCCGPFGNILAHQLLLNNKENIYLDIGSTLNPWLQSEGFKRDYYCNGYFLKRKCIWN
jgi:hypothetical protein